MREVNLLTLGKIESGEQRMKIYNQDKEGKRRMRIRGERGRLIDAVFHILRGGEDGRRAMGGAFSTNCFRAMVGTIKIDDY